MSGVDTIEQVAAALAKAHGLDWNEVCGGDDCESSTCVAAWCEDHDPAWVRQDYRKQARAACAALGVDVSDVGGRS